jgi:hypothetical protein
MRDVCHLIPFLRCCTLSQTRPYRPSRLPGVCARLKRHRLSGDTHGVSLSVPRDLTFAAVSMLTMPAPLPEMTQGDRLILKMTVTLLF